MGQVHRFEMESAARTSLRAKKIFVSTNVVVNLAVQYASVMSFAWMLNTSAKMMEPAHLKILDVKMVKFCFFFILSVEDYPLDVAVNIY